MILENHRCCGGDAALKFGCGNSPFCFSPFRTTGYQAARDVVAIAALALNRVAGGETSSALIEELAGERTAHRSIRFTVGACGAAT